MLTADQRNAHYNMLAGIPAKVSAGPQSATEGDLANWTQAALALGFHFIETITLAAQSLDAQAKLTQARHESDSALNSAIQAPPTQPTL